MGKYENYNARPVLDEVERMIAELSNNSEKSCYNINDVYDRLSIFDWWKNNITMTDLKKMRSFLQEAISLGYTGYVCFKVGVKGCANGMWAHTEETENGYSPNNCPTLYHSFVNGDNYWSFAPNGRCGDWIPKEDEDVEFDSLNTISKFEKAWNEYYPNGLE